MGWPDGVSINLKRGIQRVALSHGNRRSRRCYRRELGHVADPRALEEFGICKWHGMTPWACKKPRAQTVPEILPFKMAQVNTTATIIERWEVSDVKGLDGAPASRTSKASQDKRKRAAVCFRTPARGGALGCRVRSGHQGTLYITVSTGTVHERGSEN